MLRHLHVTNLAVVENASVDFERSLVVLTGETGAGKSLVVDSLQLLGGARASAELLRTGAEQMTVSGVFDLADSAPARQALEAAGIDCAEDQLVIRREVTRSGRNRVFVNDQPATLRLLAEVSASLLRIHGQRDELGLVTPELQRIWVDRMGGPQGGKVLAECAHCFDRYQQVAAKLERLVGDERALKERIDLLRYQASEIESVGLVPGEETELRAERSRVRHAEEISSALSSAQQLLSEDDDSVISRLARARQALRSIVDWDAGAVEWLSEIEDSRIRMQEVAASVAGRLDEGASEPGRLDSIENRLATLERVLRKYGDSSERVLERQRQIQDELAELEVGEDRVEELEDELAARLVDYEKSAAQLSKMRQEWARQLERRMGRELAELALGRARFEVTLGTRTDSASALSVGGSPVEMHPWGYDQVTFQLSSNPGEEPRPLSKVASGGELSRVYLALQTAAQSPLDTEAATLVFDEVDSGIGGAAAAVVGRKLRRLGAAGQVIAVTHLPQVACQGHQHLRLAKTSQGGRTRVQVEALDPDRRIEEIARMLGGEEITALARQHAAELIAEAESEAESEGKAPNERRAERSASGTKKSAKAAAVKSRPRSGTKPS